MCISVDLPEPDGPMTATSSPGLDVERDAAKRVDGGLALAEAAGEVVGLTTGAVEFMRPSLPSRVGPATSVTALNDPDRPRDRA